MTTRRKFISTSAGALAGLTLYQQNLYGISRVASNQMPIVVSTWNHGLPANEAAWRILENGGYALDAVEAGVRVPEADPEVISVGYGGLPDAKGKVTLDACIMDEKGRAGSVTFLEHIMHPISVARLVMEKTPHVMLSGKGALEFALLNGFKKENLLTPAARAAWKKWKKEDTGFKPVINIEKEIRENHDTIGMLALDGQGRLCGACTTSGMAFKMHGRVGDSPIIGAGMFADGKVGGAVATGTGELVMKTLGTFLVVELMRNGLSPEEACREAVNRIREKIPDYQKHQIGYVALNLQGQTGAFSIQPGFEYAIRTASIKELRKVNSLL
jgi:N4-(beta-N-acetylglucosaminyl)-L-asparaginase